MSAGRRVSTLLSPVLALTLALLLALTPGTAMADGTSVVEGRHLQLVSSTSPGAESLSPGGTAVWTVGISAVGVEQGTIHRTLVVDGALTAHVSIAVTACAEKPGPGGCAGELPLLPAHIPTAGVPLDLGMQDVTSSQWLRVVVAMDADAPAAAQALAGTLRLHARGAGDDLETAPPAQEGTEGGAGGTDGSGTSNTPDTADTADKADTADAAHTAGSRENSAASAPGLTGSLAATGLELLPWMLGAASLVLLGAFLRRRRPPYDEENRS